MNTKRCITLKLPKIWSSSDIQRTKIQIHKNLPVVSICYRPPVRDKEWNFTCKIIRILVVFFSWVPSSSKAFVPLTRTYILILTHVIILKLLVLFTFTKNLSFKNYLRMCYTCRLQPSQQVSHSRHLSNCWLKNNIWYLVCSIVYDLSTYQISLPTSNN
jgi:hypothetical protein